MYNSIFIYGANDKEFLQELYNNFNISYSIHNFDDIKKDQDHKDLITDNFRELPKLNKDAQKIFIKFYNDHFIVFSRMFVRKGLDKSNFHEDSNHFALYFYSFYEIIIKKKIDLIIFSGVPHIGPDYILYHIAKILKIRTILSYQTIFPNKYIMINDLEEFGQIKNNIDKTFKVDHTEILKNKNFYVNIQDKFYKNQERSNKSFKKQITKILADKRFFRKKLINFLIRINLIKRVDAEKEYKKNYEASSSKNETINNILNSNKKILYFPLQSQPELTALLANDFDDQLRVIEKLTSILDNKWTIIIKDHFIQTSYQRNFFFFKRLNSFKNVLIANTNYPGIELIKKANIVASCFGTSGWEALINKKKCLLFGNSWYSGLAGVLKINKNTDDETILKFINEKFNQEKFNSDLCKLYSSFYDGYAVGEWFDYLDEKHDRMQNAKNRIIDLKNFLNISNKI